MVSLWGVSVARIRKQAIDTAMTFICLLATIEYTIANDPIVKPGLGQELFPDAFAYAHASGSRRRNENEASRQALDINVLCVRIRK